MATPFDELQFWEDKGSRNTTLALDSSSNKVELTFHVGGTDNDIVCRAFVEQNVPFLYFGLWLQDYTLEYQQGLLWNVKCQYGVMSPKMPEGEKNPGGNQPDANGNVPTMKFDTGGGRANIQVAIETVEVYSNGPTPDFGTAINWDGERVQGIEVATPAFSFDETHYFNMSAITYAYRRELFLCTACTNKFAFRGFQPGEVLFLGVSGSRKGLENWELNFKFSCLPNATEADFNWIDIPPLVAAIEKKGHEYLWINFGKKPDGTAPKIVPVAQYAVVQKVYRERDFAGLQIGNF